MNIAQNLGAIPLAAGLMVKTIIGMLKMNYSEDQMRKELGRQFEALRDMREAEITDIAVELGRQTDIPAWKWFVTLRSAQDMQLMDRGNGTPPPPPPPKKTDFTTWAIFGGVALVMVGIMGRKR